MRVATIALFFAIFTLVAAQCPTAVDLTGIACTNVTCQNALPGTNPVSCQPAVDSVADRVVVSANGHQNFVNSCAVQVINLSDCTGTIAYTGVRALAQQAADTCPTTSGFAVAACTVDGVPIRVTVRESSG
ncbi:hypothetical protein AURDEDRAFT_167878 [Auricularia subglabra TFB-10046 SS5]|nr:hypothetical protein AURDEDRAFT_167878 [Auricularia subglabra TFB-10046 SS5]